MLSRLAAQEAELSMAVMPLYLARSGFYALLEMADPLMKSKNAAGGLVYYNDVIQLHTRLPAYFFVRVLRCFRPISLQQKYAGLEKNLGF